LPGATDTGAVFAFGLGFAHCLAKGRQFVEGEEPAALFVGESADAPGGVCGDDAPPPVRCF
jgi:hypothetical protein